MIKLTRGSKPSELTNEFVDEETRKFEEAKRQGKDISVWHHKWLRKALLDSTNGKCAYCECSLTVESQYMEVEHFRYKEKWPSLVLQWNNLLPSCKHCNTAKGTHDVEEEPIINPFDQNPADHLYMTGYRIIGKTELGKSTRQNLNLNDSERLVTKRFEVGEEINGKISDLEHCLELYRAKQITRNRNALTTTMNDVLNLCQPQKSYSAVCATVIHQSRPFLQIVEAMKSYSLWSTEFETKFLKSKSIALLPPSSLCS